MVPDVGSLCGFFGGEGCTGVCKFMCMHTCGTQVNLRYHCLVALHLVGVLSHGLSASLELTTWASQAGQRAPGAWMHLLNWLFFMDAGALTSCLDSFWWGVVTF